VYEEEDERKDGRKGHLETQSASHKASTFMAGLMVMTPTATRRLEYDGRSAGYHQEQLSLLEALPNGGRG